MHDATDEPTQGSFFSFINEPWTQGLKAGVDEVGIGPLAGPVVAAAVLLDANDPIDGLTDSKALTSKQREELAVAIKARALCWAVASANVAEIDELNILRASHLAMQRAVSALSRMPTMVLVDGNKIPSLPVPAISIIQGDLLVPQIGAASILAKVARDETMRQLALRYPGYGLEKHKGYPTKQHVSALRELGACAIHRRSFEPVRQALAQHGEQPSQADFVESSSQAMAPSSTNNIEGTLNR